MNRFGKSEEVFRSSPQADVRRGMVSSRPEALALSQDYNVSTDVLVRRRKECFSSLIHSSVRTVRSVCEVDLFACPGPERYFSVLTEGNVYHRPKQFNYTLR